MPGLSQEQLTAISIRLTALNWDEVQLLPWPFWHVGREEDKKRTWIILMMVQREADQETFLHL